MTAASVPASDTYIYFEQPNFQHKEAQNVVNCLDFRMASRGLDIRCVWIRRSGYQSWFCPASVLWLRCFCIFGTQNGGVEELEIAQGADSQGLLPRSVVVPDRRRKRRLCVTGDVEEPIEGQLSSGTGADLLPAMCSIFESRLFRWEVRDL